MGLQVDKSQVPEDSSMEGRGDQKIHWLNVSPISMPNNLGARRLNVQGSKGIMEWFRV